jgi:hypothetical protein
MKLRDLKKKQSYCYKASSTCPMKLKITLSLKSMTSLKFMTRIYKKN